MVVLSKAPRSASANTLASTGAVETPLGWIGVRFHGEHLQRVSIGNRSRREAYAAVRGADEETSEDALTAEQLNLLERLGDALSGSGEDFRDVTVDLGHLRPFARRVAQRCRSIPRGSTMTYAELAAACGSPGAARAVGNVMATNRLPPIVPCHRVVGSSGSLGGFSAPTGIALKRKLLELEGALPVKA
jgi:methylated-DNA-[protein]-cysteine S-methyltransferase